MGMKTLQQNFVRLKALGLPLEDLKAMQKLESGKSQTPGYMDLHWDFLYKDRPGTYIIALSHYWRHDSGDMMADPDMEIRVCPELQIIEAMTFQQDGCGSPYQVVYGEGGVDKKLFRSLNIFLAHWLVNCYNQGHRLISEKEPA